MQYPVGNGTKEDFYKNWRIGSGLKNDKGKYGYNRGSYYHSGVDLNLKTGGNTDMGEPVKAILKGVLCYYHETSHPTTSYGKHNVYCINTPWGKRWIHNAHHQSQLTGKQEIFEGQETGRIGNSGTGYAHLHMTVYKTDPATMSRGIDTVFTDKRTLQRHTEDPIEFLDKLYDYYQNLPKGGDDMSEETTALLEKYGQKTVSDLDVKIEEHVGTDWGDPQGNGGYLGAERKKNNKLTKKLALAEDELSIVEAELEEARDALTTCESSKSGLKGEVTKKANEIESLKKQLEYMQNKPENPGEKAFVETAKEVLRWLVLSLLPMILVYLGTIDASWAVTALALLRILDKSIHEYAKAQDINWLKAGITRF